MKLAIALSVILALYLVVRIYGGPILLTGGG